MKARGRRPSAFIVSRCLKLLMKHGARVFDMISQSRLKIQYSKACKINVFPTGMVNSSCESACILKAVCRMLAVYRIVPLDRRTRTTTSTSFCSEHAHFEKCRPPNLMRNSYSLSSSSSDLKVPNVRSEALFARQKWRLGVESSPCSWVGEIKYVVFACLVLFISGIVSLLI